MGETYLFRCRQYHDDAGFQLVMEIPQNSVWFIVEHPIVRNVFFLGNLFFLLWDPLSWRGRQWRPGFVPGIVGTPWAFTIWGKIPEALEALEGMITGWKSASFLGRKPYCLVYRSHTGSYSISIFAAKRNFGILWLDPICHFLYWSCFAGLWF